MYKLLIVLAFVATGSLAQDRIIYPTFPNTEVRDYSKPVLVEQRDGTIYQAYPNTTVRDFTAPSYVKGHEGGTLAPLATMKTLGGN